MIIINDNVKQGDIVYCWFSNINEKKKPKESEFKVIELTKDKLHVKSSSGDYDMFFSKELMMSMYGNCRKAI